MSLTLRLAPYPQEQTTLEAIRRRVFHQEQQVPEQLDFDGQDAVAQHLLAEWQGKAVATLRLRAVDANTHKIERLAVLPEYRRRGIAKALMESALDHLKQQGGQRVWVHAQCYIQPLYDRLEFVPQGEPFLEAGIEHVKMVRCI